MADKLSRPSRSDKDVQDAPTVIVVDSSERVLEALSIIGGASQDASRNPYAALKDEVPTGEFPHVDDVSVEASLIEVSKGPMSNHRGPDGPVSRLMVLEGSLIGWCLVRMLSEWSGLGLLRMCRLLTKKFPGHSLTTGSPSTRGTLLSCTCTIFTLTASAYRQWLVGRNTPSPSSST